MAVRVAINGFGRIGRLALRAALERGEKRIEFVAVNDLASNQENIHLLQYDSVHGRLAMEVKEEKGGFSVGGNKITCCAESDPARLPWSGLKIDVVMECTGRFTARAHAEKHVQAGAERVLISGPSKDADKVIVYGVNEKSLEKKDRLVSNASCTTNCLATVAMVLNDFCGIERGHMTTVHAYTGDQRLQDLAHQDLRRARGAALSMIPTSTGAASAIGLVLPELDGRITGTAIRVPTPNVSLVDLIIQPKKAVKIEEMTRAFRDAAKGRLKDILSVSDVPLVSSDFNHSSFSSVYDATESYQVDGKLVRVLSWYDNEWGFANRMVDMAGFLGRLG